MDLPFLIKLGLTFGILYVALSFPVIAVAFLKSRRWVVGFVVAHISVLGLCLLCLFAQMLRTLWGF